MVWASRGPDAPCLLLYRVQAFFPKSWASRGPYATFSRIGSRRDLLSYRGLLGVPARPAPVSGPDATCSCIVGLLGVPNMLLHRFPTRPAFRGLLGVPT
jgi:hypothetical protein